MTVKYSALKIRFVLLLLLSVGIQKMAVPKIPFVCSGLRVAFQFNVIIIVGLLAYNKYIMKFYLEVNNCASVI